MAMDRVVERRQPRYLLWLALPVAVALVLGARVLHRTLTVPVVAQGSVETALVRRAAFEDVVNVRGTVMPARTVILSANLGGQLESIYVEEGDFVEAGQLLFDIGNLELQLDVIARQTDLSTQMNILRQNKLSATERVLQLERDTLNVRNELDAARTKLRRSEPLNSSGALSEEVLDDLNRAVATLQSEERMLQTAMLDIREQSRQQEEEVTQTIAILRNNLELSQNIIDKLAVRAPIAGRLADLEPEVGASLQRGDSIARIEDESRLKVEATIDEFHIARVSAGLSATASYGDDVYGLAVDRVYPKVTNGQFRVDMTFAEDSLVDLRIGQSLTVKLTLGEGTESLVLPVGPYVGSEADGFVYLVSESGETAERRSVRFGRRNSSQVEVLSGLMASDEVVVSQYTDFIDSDKISLQR